MRKGHSASLLAAVLLLAPAAQARTGLKDAVAGAEKICFLPLSEEPFVLTISVQQGDAFSRATEIRETLIAVDGIRSFNEKLRAEAERLLQRKLDEPPREFLVEKKGLGRRWKAWDLKNLPCDFYLEAEFENGSHEREASFRLSRIDTAEDASYIPISVPWAKIGLYEKLKPGKKGKKRASAAAVILGRHKAESAPGKRPVDLIKPRVEALLAGRKPEDDLDTEYFPWVAEYYARDAQTLEKGFKIHARMLRERAPGRLLEVVDAFAKDLGKRLRK